jgi:hypothetical protein
MPLHRLVTPTYIGGLPGTHDLINDGTPDDAAADGQKVGGSNEDTYFVAFGEDATSSNANRPHKALAQNTDFIDDVISGQMPQVTEEDVTAPGGTVGSYQLTDSVYVSSTYAVTQANRDRLIQLTDDQGNEIVDPATGQKIEVDEIRKSDNVTNAVGNEASGFTTNPYVYFTPDIPDGVNFRITYAKKATLVDALPTTSAKTAQDFLTRLAIPGSSEVPYETNLALRQALRRSGSPYHVQALKASRIETPDDNVDPMYGLSKNDEMHLAVDSTDDAGAVPRYLRLFLGSGEALHVREQSSKGNNFITIHGARTDLALEDERMDSANGAMPLTDPNHTYLRHFDEDAGSQPSLFAMINSRVIMTCGDGVTTFGDFNGSTAVHDAVTFWKNYNAAESAIIYVKAGIYTHATNIPLANGRKLTIIGVSGRDDGSGADAVQLDNTHTGDAVFTVGSGAGTELHIENVSFTKGGTSTKAIYVATGGKLYMRNCRMTSCNIYVAPFASFTEEGAYCVHLEDCRIDMSALVAVSGPPCIHFDDTAGSPIFLRGLLFERCAFLTNDYSGVFKVNAYAGATSWHLEKILFDKCEMTLLKVQIISKDPQGNTGLLQLVPDNTSGTPEIVDIEWRDCRVTAAGGVEDSTLVLYVRTSDGTAGSVIAVRELTVRGGEWNITAGAFQAAPVYLGGSTTTAAPNVDIVRIEDLDVELGGDYGTGTTETGAVADGAHSAFFISTSKLTRIRDLRFNEVYASSRNGELEVYAYNGDVDVDGVNIGTWHSGWTAGAAGVPEHRVRFTKRWPAGNDSNNQKFRRIICRPASTQSMATDGVIWMSCPAGVLEDCFVEHNDGAFPHAGIWLEPAKVNGVEVRGCEVIDCKYGILYYPLADPSLDLANLTVDNCKASVCDVHGICLISDDGFTHYFRRVKVANNRCTSNGGYGIMVGPSAWTSGGDDEDDIELIDNTCVQNNGSSTFNGQMVIGWDGVGTATGARGVVLGNNCGTEYFDTWGASPPTGLRGFFTRINGPLGIPAVVTDFVAVSLQQLIWNNATYRTKTVI